MLLTLALILVIVGIPLSTIGAIVQYYRIKAIKHKLNECLFEIQSMKYQLNAIYYNTLPYKSNTGNRV